MEQILYQKWKLIVVLFTCFPFSLAKGQTLEIDTIVVSRAIVNIENLMETGISNGPVIKFDICMENNLKENMIIHPSEADITICFTFKGKTYWVSPPLLKLMPFFRQEQVIIKKWEKLRFSFPLNILFYTDIINKEIKKHYDYSKELIQIIPTIRIEYMDKDLIMKTSGIKNVKLEDYSYTPKL